MKEGKRKEGKKEGRKKGRNVTQTQRLSAKPGSLLKKIANPSLDNIF